MTPVCIAAANYLVNLTNEYNRKAGFEDRILMTCKRLQKLLYFGDVIFMQKFNSGSMFTDEFYAWPSGPVIPSVYDEFVKYQDGEMFPIKGDHTPLTAQMEEALSEVFNQTVKMETEDLVEASHVSGGPWNQVFNPADEKHMQIVSKESMQIFYKNNDMFLSA